MFQLFGLNHKVEVVALNALGGDKTKGGALVIAEILSPSDLIPLATSLAVMPVAANLVTITMPAGNYIYKVNYVSMWYDTGTVTLCDIRVSINSTVVVFKRAPALAAQTSFELANSFYLNAGDSITALFNCTVAGTFARLYAHTFRIPFLP